MSGPQEGDIRVTTEKYVAHACEECGERATKRHTFLLENARNNPASSGYRGDDISWCSDGEVFTCDTCKPTAPHGMKWCSTFTNGDRFRHMFFVWVKTAERMEKADG